MKYKARSVVFLFFVFLVQSCGRMNKPLVIGHRGAMGHETENTLASIQKALDLGVDAMEIDVFKIKSSSSHLKLEMIKSSNVHPFSLIY